MADVKEMPQMTVHMLLGKIEEFICSNRHSGDVSLRWFADYMEGPLGIARRLRSDNLDDVERAAISVFRLHEIEDAKAQHQKQIDELEREASKLSA